MTDDEGDFNWVNELVAGAFLAAVILLAVFIGFLLFGYIGARLGFF